MTVNWTENDISISFPIFISIQVLNKDKIGSRNRSLDVESFRHNQIIAIAAALTEHLLYVEFQFCAKMPRFLFVFILLYSILSATNILKFIPLHSYCRKNVIFL
jgi:hypothetical protein